MSATAKAAPRRFSTLRICRKELFEQAAALRSECVISVTGKVRQRPEGTNNPKIPTGEIEVVAKELEVLNMAEVLPFPVDDPEVASKVNEELRLKYRYLDLRRPEMARNLRLRSKVATATRVFLDEQGFLEVETPTLFKSTPEGAREFLVPSRVNPGTFYALPQSPQQFKQILMVGGVEKYFQLARCYRDEDLRADRQPEFTQIDIEMSFIEREDIYALIEGLLKRIWKTALNLDVPTPFKRISFEEALNRWGIDKPDTRFGMELVDFTEEFRASKFKVFSGAVAAGGVVKALNAKGLAGATQGQIETMTEYAKSFGAKGLAYIKVEKGQTALRRMEIAHREIFQRCRKGRADAKVENRGRRFDSVRRRPMAERVRNPRQDPAVLRRRFESAGEADDSRRPV